MEMILVTYVGKDMPFKTLLIEKFTYLMLYLVKNL